MKTMRFCLFLLAVSVSQQLNAQLSGTYRSVSGILATYEYDFGGMESTLLPADVTVSFSNDTPISMLTATIHQPIIGDTLTGPDFGIVNLFPLTVTGTSTDGRRFQGNLLGTQYLFDWTIEPATDGELSWNGTVYWAGGHIERSTITNARLVAVPEPTSFMALLTGVVAMLFRRRTTAAGCANF